MVNLLSTRGGMRVTRQSWFVLAVSVFYALCTAGVTATGLVDAIDRGASAVVMVDAALLVAVAVICGFVAATIRKPGFAKKTNLVAIVGFTAVYVAGVFVAGSALSLLIFPACMVVFLLFIQSQQEWLASEQSL